MKNKCEDLIAAKEWYRIAKEQDNKLAIEILENKFPELAESEDEKIRKWLINYFREVCDNVAEKEKNAVLAWLDKQDEQKEYNACDTCDEKVLYVNPCPIKLVKQRSTWSDEDERYSKVVVSALSSSSLERLYQYNKVKSNDIISWIKSLKDRVQPKQEWSEDDKYYHNIILYILNNECVGKTDKENAVNWFQSLKERIGNFDDGYKVGFSAAKHNQWKPSDEQMRILDLAIRCGINVGTTEETTLVSLFNDLKKLREE